ncbi:hypothetical protein SRIMM317S_02265 [Streptomyces rimosus subsp. rimosus]
MNVLYPGAVQLRVRYEIVQRCRRGRRRAGPLVRGRGPGPAGVRVSVPALFGGHGLGICCLAPPHGKRSPPGRRASPGPPPRGRCPGRRRHRRPRTTPATATCPRAGAGPPVGPWAALSTGRGRGDRARQGVTAPPGRYAPRGAPAPGPARWGHGRMAVAHGRPRPAARAAGRAGPGGPGAADRCGRACCGGPWPSARPWPGAVLIGTSAVLLLAQVLAWLLPPRDPRAAGARTGPCTSAAPRASSASSWCPWWEPRWARSARST